MMNRIEFLPNFSSLTAFDQSMSLAAINAKAVAINSTFKNGKVDVVSPDIESLSLCTALPLFARVYIGPWLLLYPLAAYAFYIEYDRYIKSIGMHDHDLLANSTNP